MRPSLKTSIRIIVFLMFAIIIYTQVDFKLLGDALRQIQPKILLIAGTLSFLNIGIRAYRWKRIFNKDTQQLTFKDAYIITLIGVALNVMIPATLGDVIKSYYGYKIYGIKEEMLATSTVDKIFGLCSLFLLGFISGLFMQYYILSGVSLFIAMMFFLPLKWPKVFPWNLVNSLLRIFKKSLDVKKLLQSFTLSPKQQVILLSISLGGWICTALYFYVICAAFPVTVSFWYSLLLRPILTIIRLCPFTINAMGVREVVFIYLLGLIGINPTLSVLISLTANAIAEILPGMAGFVLILSLGHRTRQHVKETP